MLAFAACTLVVEALDKVEGTDRAPRRPRPISQAASS